MNSVSPKRSCPNTFCRVSRSSPWRMISRYVSNYIYACTEYRSLSWHAKLRLKQYVTGARRLFHARERRSSMFHRSREGWRRDVPLPRQDRAGPMYRTPSPHDDDVSPGCPCPQARDHPLCSVLSGWGDVSRVHRQLASIDLSRLGGDGRDPPSLAMIVRVSGRTAPSPRVNCRYYVCEAM